jgi:PII-like signaling protein
VRTSSTGKLLRIFVGERDRWEGRPLYAAIVEKLREAGISGATVFKGIEGYGGHAVVHAARVVDIAGDLPTLVEAIDSEERIAGVLPSLEAMIPDGLMTLETVELIRCSRERDPKGEAR